MKKVSSEDFDKLERLLKSKQFPELLPDEQQWVLRLLSEDEYREMAAFYLVLADEAAKAGEIEPSPHSKMRLDLILEQLDSRKKHGFFSIRIPVYQSVAACIIFFLLGFGVQFLIQREAGDQNPNTMLQSIVLVGEKTDSLQKTSGQNPEQEIPDSEIKQVFQKPQKKDSPENKHMVLARGNSEASYLKSLAEHNIKHAQKELSGSSLGSDSVIQKLLVTIY